jgi:protein-S-isoprenylcysteine O-methyltransferase Ste14
MPGWSLPSAFAVPLGVLCALAGLGLDKWAQRTLRQAGTAIHPSGSTSAVISAGPFRYSRNPIYIAQGLLLAAVGFLVHSLAFFLAFLPWYVVMRFGVVAPEERYLVGKFGAAFEDYMNRVRRWL